ncbi:MAG: addiction module protein [Kiritimatiellae bacterium]|nr:addiction module protein [Kiritimatiellia bacterium]
MTTTAKKLLSSVLTLPPVDRAEFIDALIHSFGSDAFDEARELRWKLEVVHRIHAYEQGMMETVTEEELFAKVNR